MKNNKGFTIIELGVCICLVTIISFLLFQMITAVKKIYFDTDLKTTLLTKQAIMTKKIYDDLDQKGISSIKNCDTWQNSCLVFTFSDASTSTLLVDPINHAISYNNYIINYHDIDETIRFGELTYYNSDKNDFFAIKIPITAANEEGDFGIKIIKQPKNANFFYSTNYSDIIIPITYESTDESGNTTVTTTETTIKKDSSDDYWMKVYDANDEVLNNALSSKLKYLKLDTCSSTTNLTGNVYELKVGNTRWCQTNNFYTQGVGTHEHISGTIETALGRDTYSNALKNGTLGSTELYLKVNNFINKYTFIKRQ